MLKETQTKIMLIHHSAKENKKCFLKSLTTFVVGKTMKKPNSSKKLSTQIVGSNQHFPLKKIRNFQVIADFQSGTKIYKMHPACINQRLRVDL